MKEDIIPIPELTWSSSRFTRASWGAIFAGTFVIVVFQIMFTLLGTAIGFASINPNGSQTNGQNLAIGSAVWLLVTTLISIWVGACIAGRLSGGPRRADGLIHGIVTWSVATIIMAFLLTTALSALIGGATSLLSTALGSGNGQTGQTIAAAAENMFPGAGALLPPTGRTQGQQTPGQLTALAQQDPELATAVGKMASAGAGNNAADRDQVVNLLVTKHNMDQQQAADLVAQWERNFQQVHAQVSQKAQQVGQQAAQGISQGALGAFIALILGLLVSAWGGWAGTASLPAAVEVKSAPAAAV
jgi:hypothetical protein